MTDKEIIKALECCRDKIFKGCDNCPMDEDNDCIEIVCANALNLIKRQQAEIESIISTDNQMIKSLNKCYEKARAEAIKEFAKRLGEYIEYRYNENCDFVPYVRLSDIEKVEKEMVGADIDK